MESSLVEPKRVEHTFHQEFERLCPFYISIGMTYNQFWYENVELTRIYLEAYRLKQKREAEESKWKIWEQGLYIYEALCDVSPILRAFSKARKPLPYPSKPYGIEEFDEKKKRKRKNKKKEEELEKKKEELNLARTQIFFQNWARATKKHFEKEK